MPLNLRSSSDFNIYSRTNFRPFLIVVKKGKRGVKNRLLFEDGAKRHQVSRCLASFFFFCVKQSSQVLIFGSFYQVEHKRNPDAIGEKEQAKYLRQYKKILKAQVERIRR